MIFSIGEVIDLVFMTLFLGWLFSDSFRRPTESKDIKDFRSYNFRGIKWRDIQFSAMIIAPGILLHELAHKFVAMAFGVNATFYAFYRNETTLLIGIIAVIMKLANAGFMLIVPGFVMHGAAGPMESALIAFAGPLVHLIIWLAADAALRLKKLDRKKAYIVHLTKQINMLLLIFNMLPIPGFDGWQVYSEVFRAIFP